jgi:predicted alpha-1,2-mannosidase
MKHILWCKYTTLLFVWQSVLVFNVHAQPHAGQDTSLTPQTIDYIDPTIGNIAQLLEPTRPTADLPNQIIRVYPIRKDYTDDRISSFPLTAVSHRLGEVFSLKPSGRPVTGSSWSERMPYDHELEVTRPWYYSTFLLDEGITVEFTPGKRSGCYRFSFPKISEPVVLMNVYNGGESGWHFLSPTEVEGMETWQGGIKVYMYGVFNVAGTPDEQALSARSARTYIHFPSGPAPLEFKYAISFVSPEQARKNFAEEAAKTDFTSMRQHAMNVWSKLVSQIKVEGGTLAQKRSFYTALYRCHERMVDITEDGAYYSGFNKQVDKDSRPFYVDDWSWDTYLALHPLRMILHPAQEQDMLQSYVRMFEQSGWMPSFPVLFGDYACMNGFHSSVIFLDAWRKGLRNFDIAKAYEGMRKNTTDATLLPWRNGNRTTLDDFYQAHGYFPALHPGEKETIEQVHPFEKRQAVAVTLGASYDDWALAQLAKDLGKKDDFELFSKRAEDFKNLWNPEKGFFMPRDDKGNWIDIDPKFDGGPGGRDYYDENNGWTYLWQVQEDIPGLIGLMGGKRAMEERLDQLFREDLGRSKQEFWNKFPDATALVGQYSMGNEPCFHIPYLYNYAGAPWKTQKTIRTLLSLWFKDNVFGIPGDEDGGGMSAFVVFSSMGFYPVEPGKPVYTIGSPLFSKVTISLENGKTFTLIAHQASVVNKYIQSASMNGKPLNKPWFTHQQLVDGGLLELVMGPKPNKSWGNETAQ